MLYLLYGPNRYARTRQLRELVGERVKKYPDMAVRSLSAAKEGAIEELYDAVSSQSLFESGKRLVILRDSEEAYDKDLFFKALEHARASASVIVFMTEDWHKEKLAKEFAKLFKEGNEGAKKQFFEEIEGKKLEAFVAAYAKKEGFPITADAVRFLEGYYKGDLEQIMNEIDRVRFLGRPVTRDLLEGLDEYAQQRTLFELTKAFLFRGSVAEKLRSWEFLRLQKFEPFILFNYLAKASSAQPLVENLAKADIRVKSGRLDMDQALIEALLG
jgi:DNA polymerase III delta subunit